MTSYPNSPAYPDRPNTSGSGPALLVPLSPATAFSTAVKTPLPPSPDYHHALKTLMDTDPPARYENGVENSSNIVIGRNGLLDVRGSTGGTTSVNESTRTIDDSTTLELNDFMHHSLSASSANMSANSSTSYGSGSLQTRGKKRPATGSMDLSNQLLPCVSTSRRV